MLQLFARYQVMFGYKIIETCNRIQTIKYLTDKISQNEYIYMYIIIHNNKYIYIHTFRSVSAHNDFVFQPQSQGRFLLYLYK